MPRQPSRCPRDVPRVCLLIVDSERPFNLGAVQTQHDERQESERGRSGGHHFGPDASDARFADGFSKISPFSDQTADLSYQHQTVLDRNSKQAYQPNERRDIPRLAHHEQGENATHERDRYGAQNQQSLDSRPEREIEKEEHTEEGRGDGNRQGSGRHNGTRPRLNLMSQSTTVLILFVAAILEAGGDALVRAGLRTPVLLTRVALFALGGLVLFSYGYVVNAPAWDFGRLLGIYVVFFFVIAQILRHLGCSWS